MCKENYRSVNVLAVVSKIFEIILSDQLMAYFVSILSHSLSAYRAGYSCQHVILQLTEFWRQSLDKGNYVRTVAMDLSTAFDSMPHGLLIAKLSAYGVSKQACNLIIKYLCNRRKKTKVMDKCNEWVSISRGVPQSSVLGPLLFKTGNHYKWDWPKSQFSMPDDSATVVWLRNLKVGNVYLFNFLQNALNKLSFW